MKCQIIVHDVTYNKVETVGGVPALMGFLAYLENRVENEVKDVITTIMAPLVEYDLIGRGQGFELLSSFDEVGKQFFNSNPHVLESLENYMQFCVIPDMTYGWIDQKALFESDDIWAGIRSETMSRSSKVVTIDAGGRRSVRAFPCPQAYNEINGQMTVARLQRSLSEKCMKDVGDGAREQDACVNMVTGLFDQMIAPGLNTNTIIRNYIVAWSVMSKGGMLNTMLTDMNKRNISGAFMAEKTLPRLKGMMFGLIIGIFPFLVAFLWITPGKTAAFYGGLFILMILWNAIDTFMDMQYQNEVFNMYSIMRAKGLGLYQMFDIPNIAADAVSLYGQGRWMSLGLASAITAAITGISTHALSSMGAQLTATAQGAAASASQYADSAGQSRLMEKGALDAGARSALAQTSMPNFMGMAHGETQRIMTNAQTGQAWQDYGGNAGAASMQTSNALDSGTSRYGGFSGEKSVANALGFSNLESYQTWQQGKGAIDGNMVQSMIGHGVNPNVAMQAEGLALNSINMDENGNITNFSAKGIGADGQDRSVSMAENVGRFQVQGASQNIAGFNVGNGANVTAKYGADGGIAQLSVEGAGYTRFSHNAITGETSGVHAFTGQNGINYTEEYRGNNKTTSFTDATGDSIVRQEQKGMDGGYHAFQTDTMVGGKGYSVDGIMFQEGSKISQGADGVITANGAFEANGMTYKGSITTDANGATVSMLGDNGKTFNQNDINNINRERMVRNAEGKTVSRGDSYNFDDGAIAQAIAAGRGDKALGVVMEQYNAMNQYEQQLRDNRMVGILNNPYKENYDKSLAEYTMSAANGLSGVVGMSTSASHQFSKSQSKDNLTTAEISAGGNVSLGVGSDNVGLKFQGGGSIKNTEQEKTSLGENRTGALQVNRNELTNRIREEVVKGLDAGLSADQIDKNINENVLMK